MKIKRGYPLYRHQQQISDTINQSKLQCYYNYSPYPTDAISPEIEFVPMISTVKDCVQNVYDHINALYNQSKIKYCLILNEPDQANMTFDQIIQNWYSIRTNLNKNIKISSPVYASLTKGRQELKAFFDALTSRKIQKPDFISLHLYRSLDDYTQVCDDFYNEFKLPIWVTEFAPTHGTKTESKILSWYTETMSKFDGNPHIQRYAYFGNGCTDALRKVALFTESGITGIGHLYFHNTPKESF